MNNQLADPSNVVEELLKTYPPKVGRKRAKHIVLNNPESPLEVEANVRTVPGIITQRGCCYAGCKGVVVGPIADAVTITHGPVGCGYYSWLTRRNLAKPNADGQHFLSYCFTTDLQEEHIVFGGMKPLAKAVREAYTIFKPKLINICSTCPVGLIGDDINTIAKDAQAELGIPVIPYSCEGYKGVSQSAGHHIANNNFFKGLIGTAESSPEVEYPYSINILGEYNIGGDSWVIEDLLDRCGIKLICTLSGDVHCKQIQQAHHAKLNVLMCHRSINYMAEMMETKFGIPWMKVNFISAHATAKSLRKIVRYFGDAELIERAETVIAEEMAKVAPVLEEIKTRCNGKTTMLFVGGSRAHHYQSLFTEMGIKVISAGYEFAHRDDYEGRRVIPTIKVDADSRNIEELHVERDPSRYVERKTPDEIAKLNADGVDMADYTGMMSEMERQAIVIDDISHHEMDKMIHIYKPDVFCSGIKDKYIVQKMGVPCKQLHNYDYGGPYAGFAGAINFYKEIDRMVNTRILKYLTPPWKARPQVNVQYGV
jgi:nitrogenase molybdenum-iron protein alpha chain